MVEEGCHFANMPIEGPQGFKTEYQSSLGNIDSGLSFLCLIDCATI